MRSTLIILLTALSTITVSAQKQSNAVKTTDAIIVDGVLDELVWSQALPITGFSQKMPNPTR